MPSLNLRKTYKYVDSCSDLDEWVTVGEFEILWKERVDTDKDGYEYWANEYLIKVSSDSSVDEVIAALKSEFTYWGCHHDYDCCGCPLLSVSNITKVSEDNYYLVQTGSRNY
jgi:hypothetical protein